MNQSALGSLEEGLEETLTLHRLGMMPTLSQSFRTTNCIENVNSLWSYPGLVDIPILG